MSSHAGLDKALYREACRSLREWGEAAERARPREHPSSAELWQRHVALVEFSWRLCPEPSAHQRREKIAALNRYYERVQKLQEWRRARGKTP